MKVLLDSNVVLAAFATRGLCEAVMAVCLERHEIVAAEPLLAEVAKHLRGKFKMPAARVEEIMKFLREHMVLVEPAAVPAKSCRDANDRAILGAAVAGEVDVLITGDNDLLVLKEFQHIPIVSPRTFYDRLR